MVENKASNNDDAFDEKMLGAIREELDKSCDKLDGATLSRLNLIRHQALEKAHVFSLQNLVFPGGLVSAFTFLFFVFFSQNHLSGPVPVMLNTPAEDLEIWASSDSIEFLEELEFYQWLAENDPSV